MRILLFLLGIMTCPITLGQEALVKPPAELPKQLSYSRLHPSVPVDQLTLYHYAVSTKSKECQKFCDLGFGYYYSYVWMEATRAFETALHYDPECALAWLMLHRSLEKYGKSSSPSSTAFLALAGTSWIKALPELYGKSPKDRALDQAQRLLDRCNHREKLLIMARLYEKGLLPNVKPEERKKKAIEALDELITLYDDDQEGWFWRAQIAEGKNAKVPFYKALLRINPVHPGANHELVHYFENIRRPALGWPFAEKYMESSPKIPHAWHMQAHLAMRIGKWKSTSNWSYKAVQLEQAYHKYQQVNPRDDFQYRHHVETLTRSLVHDGRFDEVRAVQKAVASLKYEFLPEWFRMAVTEENWKEAEKITDKTRSRTKTLAAYYNAVVALHQGNLGKARAELNIMLQDKKPGKSLNKTTESRILEIEGRILCQSGEGTKGCQKFHEIIAKMKDDYSHHAWGGGAYFMEIWGIAALEAGEAKEADEAFQEALAHDAGSVRGALGMWALCNRTGRTAEAARYLKVAKRCWAQADPNTFNKLQQFFADRAENIPVTPTFQNNK